MKVLILHGIDDPARIRRTTLNRSFCMPKHRPAHDYTFHAIHHEPGALATQRFDAILLDATFLGYRWLRPRPLFDALIERYDFVRRADAVKLAFPQDDYDHCAMLDRWLHDWRVDVVFTPLPRFVDVLYPQTSSSAQFESALTGYVDPLDEAILARVALPHRERQIDVAYRARDLPPNFGRAGQLKAEIGRRFIEGLPADHGLRLDISTDPDATIVGDEWLAFLGRTKSFLGSASGSSLLDPEGELQDAVAAYIKEHPHASFAEVEAACFPGLDGRYLMTVLGPRNLECAAARTCQILVPDEGLAPFEPGVHYLALDSKGREAGAVADLLADEGRIRAVIDAAEALVKTRPFQQAELVERICARIDPRLAQSGGSADGGAFELQLAERLVRAELERAELAHKWVGAERALREAAETMRVEREGRRAANIVQRIRRRIGARPRAGSASE